MGRDVALDPCSRHGYEDGKANPSRRIGWEELEPPIAADEPAAEAAA